MNAISSMECCCVVSLPGNSPSLTGGLASGCRDTHDNDIIYR